MRTIFVAMFLAALTGPMQGAPVGDFKLLDVNPNSPRRNALVSPRDYRLQASGYYFGAAH